MNKQLLTFEEFIDTELRDTIVTINSIINTCWNLAGPQESHNNQDRHNWISLAKDACALKVGILTDTSFLKTARAVD